MKESHFRKLTVTIIGLGQIGGSLALTFRKNKLFKTIHGYDRDKNTTKTALRKGLIDSASSNLAQAVRSGDIVILAVPVGQIMAILPEVAKNLKPEAMLCETGSTKEKILKLVEKLRVRDFVGLHPVAGTEKEGVKGWNTELFTGKTITLTASGKCDENSKGLIKTLIRAIDAIPREIPAPEHDRIFSAISHLPYLLSVALLNSVINKHNRDQISHFLGGAFRDTTRVAASSPSVMKDILFSNRKNIVESLSTFIKTIDGYRDFLEKDDRESMLAKIITAKKIRSRLKFS